MNDLHPALFAVSSLLRLGQRNLALNGLIAHVEAEARRLGRSEGIADLAEIDLPRVVCA